jgi:hypothetical protein
MLYQENLMTTSLTIRLSNTVASTLAGMAADRGRELADFAASILTTYAAEHEQTGDSEALEAANGLLDEAISKAREIRDGVGTIPPDVTLQVARWIRGNRLAEYERAIAGNAMGAKNPLKHLFNKRLGRSIKVSLSAASVMQNGEPETVFVSGEIIRSYTPLQPAA